MREFVAMVRRITYKFADLIRPAHTGPKVSPVNPAIEFARPKNAGLFALLERWLIESGKENDDEHLWVHPDLIERFRGLAPANEVKQGAAYLRVVTANSFGLIFAWATGTNTISFRLPRCLHRQAIEDGGRFDPTYGNDWIEFPAWSSSADGDSPWVNRLEKWARIALDESLNLEVES